jgi:hypothetical protein
MPKKFKYDKSELKVIENLIRKGYGLLSIVGSKYVFFSKNIDNLLAQPVYYILSVFNY